jgi:uncharacterized protein (TIGR02996 family)
MNDWNGLRDQMVASPYDKTIPMVAADWLEENGQPDAAALLRKSGWNNCGLEKILDKTIYQINLMGSQDYLELIMEDGSKEYIAAYGDCCSDSWFYRIDNPQNIIGSPIIAFLEATIEDINIEDGLGRQDEDKAYAISIMTMKGICRIVYRNSSNGYYGGWVQMSEAPETTERLAIDSDWIYKK